MIKSLWVEVIKQHTEPFKGQEQERVVRRIDGREGSMEVFLQGLEHTDYGGGGHTRLEAQRVRIDSDDFLVLYDHTEWSDGERDTISYVLWRDIRTIKFYWAGRK